MAVWKFRFNASGVAHSSGLSLPFSRNVATVDPSGEYVLAIHSRFDRAMRLAPVITPTLREASIASLVLASGLGADGSTWLALWLDLDFNHARLRLYRGGTSTYVDFPLTAEYTSQDARDLGAQDYYWTLPVNGLGTLSRFVPQTAVIFHGCLAICGKILTYAYTEDTPRYDISGWGLVMRGDSTSSSVGWDWKWDDTGFPRQYNHPRGCEWCLRVAPIGQRSVTHPLQAWLVCVDYLEQQPAAQPTGGRAYLSRVDRPNTSTDWDIDPPNSTDSFAYFDLPPGDILSGTSLPTGCHAHACHLIEYDTAGMQLLVSLGDAQESNRFARLTRSSTTGDYTTGWTTTDNFHARRNVSPDVGSYCGQPVGAAWGPSIQLSPSGVYASSVVWGSDETSDLFIGMTPPLPSATVQQAGAAHLWGLSTGFGSQTIGADARPKGIVFTINEPRLEVAGPLVAVWSDHDTLSDGSSVETFMRVLYCRAAATTELGRWIQVASATTLNNQGTAALFGDTILYAKWGASDGGLYSVPVPTDSTVFHPVIVSPGGSNLVHAAPAYVTGDQAYSISVITRANANAAFVDGSLSLPKPPSKSLRLYKIVSLATNTATTNQFLAQFHVSSNSTSTWNVVSPYWSSTDRIRRYRAFVLNGSFNQTAFSPNKTLQLGSYTMNESGPTTPFAPSFWTGSNRWCPSTIIGWRSFSVTGGFAEALGIQLTSNFFGNTPPDDNCIYIVIDGAFDDWGDIPYPMDAQASNQPDELLTVEMVSGGPVLDVSTSASWSLRLAGMTPEGAWDLYADRREVFSSMGTDHRFWPNWALVVDDDNYVEFQANCVIKGYTAVLYVSGVATTTADFGSGTNWWLPNSPHYWGLGYQYSGGTAWLSIGATLGGAPVQVYDDGSGNPLDISALLGRTFTKIVFRAGGSSPIPNEVVGNRWFGGAIDDANTLTNSTLPNAFTDIDWIKGP
ncbi:MAG: hypothetical protein JNM07_05815 [Phycisphaerae bacterium]|nr:hypothetical protein [Phycisphaerae bacterium]